MKLLLTLIILLLGGIGDLEYLNTTLEEYKVIHPDRAYDNNARGDFYDA